MQNEFKKFPKVTFVFLLIICLITVFIIVKVMFLKPILKASLFPTSTGQGAYKFEIYNNGTIISYFGIRNNEDVNKASYLKIQKIKFGKLSDKEFNKINELILKCENREYKSVYIHDLDDGYAFQIAFDKLNVTQFYHLDNEKSQELLELVDYVIDVSPLEVKIINFS